MVDQTGRIRLKLDKAVMVLNSDAVARLRDNGVEVYT